MSSRPYRRCTGGDNQPIWRHRFSADSSLRDRVTTRFPTTSMLIATFVKVL